MDDFPLNLAHQQERIAEKLIKQGKFKEALLCYQNAAGYLDKSMCQTSDPVALQSLQLQKQRYIDHEQLMTSQAEHYESLRKQKPEPSVNHRETLTVDADLQEALSKNLEQYDTLLQVCFQKAEAPEDVLAPKSQDEIIRSAIKFPKPEQTVIEELRLNKEELHKLIQDLTQRLEMSEQENRSLKTANKRLAEKVRELTDRVKRLEHNDLKSLSNSSASLNIDLKDSINTGLSSGQPSPLVTTNIDLPELAPLELPHFEY